MGCLLAAACTTWKPVAKFDRWSLYADSAARVDPAPYQAAFDPALAAVEEVFGPFRKTIRVYAWDGGEGAVGREQVHEGEGGPVEDVPGIGPARVKAFHARSDGLFGSPSGVFLGSAEPGTAVHELVHARLAEEDVTLPLWLEEGLACFLGDGFLDQGRWTVDGLSCWPLRELTEQRLSDADIARLLDLRAERTASVRDNVLAHFLGWAIVFDLRREAGSFDWRAWCERYSKGMSLAEARARLDRTTSDRTALDWMKRLSDPDPATRLAAAKGVWKLRSTEVLETLVDALEREQDPEVRIGLAINALAAAGEVKTSRPLTRRLWNAAMPTLRRAELPDPAEQAAIGELVRSFRFGGSATAQGPLKTLARFWAE